MSCRAVARKVCRGRTCPCWHTASDLPWRPSAVSCGSPEEEAVCGSCSHRRRGFGIRGGRRTCRAQSSDRLNPMIALHEAGMPVFGMYAPRASAGRRGAPAGPVKTPAQLAEETLAYTMSDFVFDGSMEGGVDRGLPAFNSFVSAMSGAGASTRTNPLCRENAGGRHGLCGCTGRHREAVGRRSEHAHGGEGRVCGRGSGRPWPPCDMNRTAARVRTASETLLPIGA